ncbi:MAG: hypothetical protein QMB62_07880 [Oscillospiraceae bacterium]
MFFFERPRWKTVEYSRSEIINAGRIIKKDESTSEQIVQATKVIDNWRAAHAYPLHVFYMHLRRMASNRTEIVVAERLKRLDSITNKLRREPNMSLWTMQDLGGCRLVVPSVKDVYWYANKYRNSRIRHRPVSEYDYILSPKRSGYRSLHLVFEYHSDTNEFYNKNMLVELQFRTHLQHLWATAVETMGLFTKQALKAGQGNEDIIRFFALVSSLFALKEGTPVVPGTSEDALILISDIKEINDREHILDILSAIRVAVEHKSGSEFGSQGYYILILNYNTRKLNIKYFKPSQSDEASTTYAQIEGTRAESQIDAVLVSVSSFQALRAAYPNYFSDIGDFIETVRTDLLLY